MPMHSGLLPREGFSIDVILRLVRSTALNPSLILPLAAAVRFTEKGSSLSTLYPTTTKVLYGLLCAGVTRVVNGWLSNKVLNNWVSDKYDWAKEIVVVTGGAGGIGGEMVKLFEEKGITVVVLDVQPMTFETSSKVHYYKCDLRSAANIDAVAERIRADVGDPTVVINNAGVARGKPVLEATPGDVRFTFDVNALAPFWTARAFVPSMVARDHGSFVTVSSVAAAMPLPNMVDYAASKAASMSLHEGLTAELSRLHGARRVRTVLVQPSHTNTGLFRGFDGGMDFMMPPLQPQTVAEEVVKKVLSGTSGNIVLPALSHIVNTLRSMPYWYQLIMRASSENMAKWNGHQVIADVDAPIEAGEAGGSSQDSMHSDVGESTVLVSSTSQ